MKCPYCGNGDSRVVDTREVGDAIRRRRECLACEERYTTYERIAKANLVVVKRDGRREPFDKEKLTEGLRVACAKRPVSMAQIEQLVNDVELALYRLGKAEVPSGIVGETVLKGLRQIDDVAFLRFASVYHSFSDLEALKQAVDQMIDQRHLQKE